MKKNMFDEDPSLNLDTNDLDIKEQLIYKRQYIANKYYIHLDEEITEPNYYRSICLVLKEAQETDEVHFIINTPGGDISSFIQIYNAMLQSKALITAEIIMAYSAGSLIALAADQIIIDQFSSMLIHSMSAGSIGKVDEMKVQTDFLKKWNEQIITKLYDSFLTEKEMQQVLEGKDFWFDEEEIIRRFEHWIPLKQRLALEQNKKTKKVVKGKK